MKTTIYQFLTIDRDLITVKSDLIIKDLIYMMDIIYYIEVISHTILEQDEIEESDIEYTVLSTSDYAQLAEDYLNS